MDPELIEKLCVAFKKKRVYDFFKDFDRTNSGRIHPVQAIRALSAVGVVLTPVEQKQLKDAYTDSLSGLFEYRQLVRDLNDTAQNGTFEQMDPTVDPASTAPAARYGLSGSVAATATSLLPRARLTEAEELELTRVLTLCKYDASTRAILLARYMKQYDDTHRGVVTASRFKREVLACFKSLLPKDADLLARAYAAPDGQVRYYALHQDVTPDEITPVPKPQRSTSPNVRLLKSIYGPGAAPRTVDQAKDTLAVLVRQFHSRRIRSTDLFRGYDRLNTGRIPRAAFIRSICANKVTGVSLPDLEALADGYADLGTDPSGGEIRWRDFCDDIEAAEYLRPSLVELEKNPEASNTTFARTVASGPQPGSSRPVMPNAEQQKLFAVMADIKGTLVRYRLWRIADMLGDFDRAHEGHITPERFLRVLAMCSCAPVKTDEKDVLLRYYTGVGTKASLVNYRAFLADVDINTLRMQA